MRGVGGRGWPERAVVSCGIALGLLGAAVAHAGGRSLGDRIPGLERARLGARERLGRPECQAVLADFESVNGGRLDLVLRSTGRTAQEQLEQLVLGSGLGRAGCGAGQLAFTRVGSSTVSICLRPFTLLPAAEQDAVLIHEMLHSLGLGENPPESVAITAQIMRRCGH